MLKSIDPILNADVLYALRAMGHGDDLVICDTNFPADAVARQTVLGRLLRIDNVTAARAAVAARAFRLPRAAPGLGAARARGTAPGVRTTTGGPP